MVANNMRILLGAAVLLGWLSGAGTALAEDTKAQNVRTISFSGQLWAVRSTWGGPGPNYFSDDPQNVWLDDNGYLHLKIRFYNGRWYCSEVYTLDQTFYGEHRFLVDSRVAQYDANVVLGLFVYKDDQHEIDIEYAKWGNANAKNMGSFTVQPWTIQGNSKSFEVQLQDSYTTNVFNWQSNMVHFSSVKGLHEGLLPAPNQFLATWAYFGPSIPAENDRLRIHINVWLFNGHPPSDGKEVEVIIRKMISPRTSTVPERGQIFPERFLLHGNYPNPFNGTTQVCFEITSAAKVTLQIVDVSGRVVEHSLAPQLFTAGTHHIGFSPDRQRTSGIYYYRIRAQEVISGIVHMHYGKMIYLK